MKSFLESYECERQKRAKLALIVKKDEDRNLNLRRQVDVKDSEIQKLYLQLN